jgi:hypothetical protein
MRCGWCTGILEPSEEATIVVKHVPRATFPGGTPDEGTDDSTKTLVHPPESRPSECAEPPGTRWMVLGKSLPHRFTAGA